MLLYVYEFAVLGSGCGASEGETRTCVLLWPDPLFLWPPIILSVEVPNRGELCPNVCVYFGESLGDMRRKGFNGQTVRGLVELPNITLCFPPLFSYKLLTHPTRKKAHHSPLKHFQHMHIRFRSIVGSGNTRMRERPWNALGCGGGMCGRKGGQKPAGRALICYANTTSILN